MTKNASDIANIYLNSLGSATTTKNNLFVVVTAEVTYVVVATVFAYNNAANFANLSKPLITFCNEEV